MELGVMSSMYSYIGVPSEQYLERFAKMGFKYVDIMTIGDLSPRYLTEKTLGKLKDNIEYLNLIPSTLIANVGVNGASADPDLRNRAITLSVQVIEAASLTGFPLVHLYLGEKEPGVPHQQGWDNMKLFIERCLKHAEQAKIVLSFESNPRIYRFVNTTDDVVRLLKEIPSPYFKATVDTGHLTICREAPDEIRKLKGKIVHAHITDNDGTSDTNETLGTGVAPLAAYLEELERAGIEETARQCGLEPVGVVELGSPDKLSLRSVDSILARSLEYLKKIDPPHLIGV